MTKFFAALKIIWELWPYIIKAVEGGRSIALNRKVKNGKEQIRLTFEGLHEADDEQVAKDIANFNDLFRK